MSVIEPGVALVCIKDDTTLGDDVEKTLTQGSIYMCEEVHEADIVQLLTYGCCGFCGENPPRVHLVERDWCYCICLFRPLNDGDTSLVKDEEEPKESFFEVVKKILEPAK